MSDRPFSALKSLEQSQLPFSRRRELSPESSLNALAPILTRLQSAEFQSNLGGGVFRQELQSLLQEPDAELLGHQLFVFAERLIGP